MDPLLQFRAQDIHLEGAPFDAALPASWIDAALSDANLALGVAEWEARSVPAGGRVTGRLSRSGNDIVVRATVAAEIVLACSRCLGPAPVVVRSELTLLLKPAPTVTERPAAGGRQGRASSRGADEGPEHEFSADEADLDLYDGEVVVLDGFVREAILLELPQFPLCAPECDGLAALPVEPEAPEPLEPEVDPRFAPLGALRERLGFSPASPLTASLELAEAAAAAPKPVLRASGRARPASRTKKKSQRRENKE